MPFPNPFETNSRWKRRLLSFEAGWITVLVVVSAGIVFYGWWAD